MTHDTIAPSAVALLNANAIDVFFSPPYTPSDEVAARCAELSVDAIMVRQGKITADVINASPTLKVIVKHGVGVDNVDIAAATARNVPVLRSMGSNALAVAEHTITLALTLIKQVMPLDRAIKAGAWRKPSFIGRDIAGSVIGLVGFGAIGREPGGWPRRSACASSCSIRWRPTPCGNPALRSLRTSTICWLLPMS